MSRERKRPPVKGTSATNCPAARRRIAHPSDPRRGQFSHRTEMEILRRNILRIERREGVLA
jgi:hypothetical protein